MDPYWLFLKTVANTMLSLMGAAAVLFTATPGPDTDLTSQTPMRHASLARASFMIGSPQASTPAQESSRAGRATVIQALVGALKDPDAGVRRHAAIALGELGDTTAIAGLVAALSDKDREVRRAVVTALGEIGDESAIEPLTRAMKDEDADVRRRAVIAIAELSDGDRDWSRPQPNPNPNPNPHPNPNPRPWPEGV